MESFERVLRAIIIWCAVSIIIAIPGLVILDAAIPSYERYTIDESGRIIHNGPYDVFHTLGVCLLWIAPIIAFPALTVLGARKLYKRHVQRIAPRAA